MNSGRYECPSCGSNIEQCLSFCPACGTKIMQPSIQTNKRKPNAELESFLYTVNAHAEVCLEKKLGAGLFGAANYQDLQNLEVAYMEIIERFPVEPMAYIAYVDYMIKYIVKLNSLTNIFATTQYFIGDLNFIVKRCKNYLEKAKKFACDSELEQILQLDSLLAQRVTALESDSSINEKQEKYKKITKWCSITLIATFAILGIATLILWLV